MSRFATLLGATLALRSPLAASGANVARGRAAAAMTLRSQPARGAADPNAQTSMARRRLYAAHLASADLVAALLARGADPNIANRYGIAPIHEAALVADGALLLTALLDSVGAGRSRAAAGRDPLMLAARTSGLAAVELLIARGANVTWSSMARADAADVTRHTQPRASGGRADRRGRRLNARPRSTFCRPGCRPRAQREFPQGGMTPGVFARAKARPRRCAC